MDVLESSIEFNAQYICVQKQPKKSITWAIQVRKTRMQKLQQTVFDVAFGDELSGRVMTSRHRSFGEVERSIAVARNSDAGVEVGIVPYNHYLGAPVGTRVSN